MLLIYKVMDTSRSRWKLPIIISFLQMWNWSSERQGNLAQVTQLVSGGVRIQIQVGPTW